MRPQGLSLEVNFVLWPGHAFLFPGLPCDGPHGQALGRHRGPPSLCGTVWRIPTQWWVPEAGTSPRQRPQIHLGFSGHASCRSLGARSPPLPACSETSSSPGRPHSPPFPWVLGVPLPPLPASACPRGACGHSPWVRFTCSCVCLGTHGFACPLSTEASPSGSPRAGRSLADEVRLAPTSPRKKTGGRLLLPAAL